MHAWWAMPLLIMELMEARPHAHITHGAELASRLHASRHVPACTQGGDLASRLQEGALPAREVALPLSLST